MKPALNAAQRALLDGARGEPVAMAMRLVSEAARLLDADSLVAVQSAHIDGCLYHGDSGTAFAERLAHGGTRVAVPTTLNVGALDLLKPDRTRLDAHAREMAWRQMRAFEALGCRPTWTCAPYQAGHRPAVGEQVAWGESNAVAFVNSVLGARTNRYGDFLDACCAATGYAPYCGLHLAENRRATVLVDVSRLNPELLRADVFYPVFGSLLGGEVGEEVAVVTGLPKDTSEDQLKALGAAAASTGSVGLFHVAGVTPEAPTVESVLTPGDLRHIVVTREMIVQTRDRLSTASAGELDVVALGSPHFSLDEFAALERLARGRRFALPVYACTGRGVRTELERRGTLAVLEAAGVDVIVDTCVVVTPILDDLRGVLMTNSGKFAHYALPNTGYDGVYGSLADCVESAVDGRVSRDDTLWR